MKKLLNFYFLTLALVSMAGQVNSAYGFLGVSELIDDGVGDTTANTVEGAGHVVVDLKKQSSKKRRASLL